MYDLQETCVGPMHTYAPVSVCLRVHRNNMGMQGDQHYDNSWPYIREGLIFANSWPCLCKPCSAFEWFREAKQARNANIVGPGIETLATLSLLGACRQHVKGSVYTGLATGGEEKPEHHWEHQLKPALCAQVKISPARNFSMSGNLGKLLFLDDNQNSPS